MFNISLFFFFGNSIFEIFLSWFHIIAKIVSYQDAEAILEDISPSPLQVVGYGVVRQIACLIS